MRLLQWLAPGFKIKRWLLLLVVGMMLFSLGVASLLSEWGFRIADSQWSAAVRYVPAIGLGLSGIGLVVFSLYQLNRSLLTALYPAGVPGLADALQRRRRQSRGPRIVAIGGGTGLSTLLRGLKEHTDHLTAIVTVADDGGSSGRLRRELGVLPPGDFRQCIAALANAEPLMTQLFEYRFGDARAELGEGGTGLAGHSFGNLFIVAMAAITGSFENALRQSSRVLNVRGRILPSTLQNVTMFGELAPVGVVRGESELPHTGTPLHRVFLEPSDPPAYPEAIQAILGADLIVVGPGSLYTSVLPNLLVPDTVRAIRASGALKVYVCNVATQPGETDGYELSDHLQALEAHVGGDLFDVILANGNFAPRLPERWGVTAVRPDLALNGHRIVRADVIDETRPTRHDPEKLAAAIMKIANIKGQISNNN